MAEPVVLQQLSDTRLDPKPYGGLLTCNPGIELFARAAGPKTLEIWRSNGQTVVQTSQKGAKETVDALRWKTDGNVSRTLCKLSSILTFCPQVNFWPWAGAMELFA